MFLSVQKICAVAALLALGWAQWHGYSLFEERAGHSSGHGSSSSRTYHK